MNGTKPRATPVSIGMTPTSPKYPNSSMSQFSPRIRAMGAAFSLKICPNESESLPLPSEFKYTM